MLVGLLYKIHPHSQNDIIGPSEGFEPSSSGFFHQLHSKRMTTAAYTNQAILRRPANKFQHLRYITVR